jgi:hypothetical protein
MMQRISRKEELVVQRPHVPLVPEKTKINVPKHFAAHPWYHGLDNDCFMYSIHNIVKDETPTQLAEEQSTDMMCMFDDISYIDNYPSMIIDDDYVAEIDVDCSKKSTHVVGRKKISYNSNMTIKLCILIKIARRKMQKIFKKVQTACPYVLPHS